MPSDERHPHAHHHAASGGVLARLRRIVAPHRHETAASSDARSPAGSSGMRTVVISFSGLLLTGVLEAVVVAFSGSVALLADTIHNFADAFTAVPLGVAFWMARRPPSKRYTYGYGRAEDLAGIFIVATIAVSGGVAAWTATQRLLHPRDVHHVGWVIVAGLIGFAGNELVAAYRIRVGRRIGSAALVADGLHARTDALTSLAVVAGALASAAGWRRADPIVGLVITVAILGIFVSAVGQIYRRLMDSVDPQVVDAVERTLAAVPGIEGVTQVQVRWVGHQLRAEAEVISDCELTITEAHAIAEEARHLLLHEVPRLTHVVIHTSPCDHDGQDHHALTAHHFAARPSNPAK